jgi:hypothetical protein
LLRIPPSRGKTSTLDAVIAPVDPQSAAKWLWSDGLTSAVERRLLSLDALDKGKRSILLASTLPSPSVRDAMVRTLKMHWDEDPKTIDAVGGTAEPGFLVVLKRLPRKDVPPRHVPTAGVKTPKAAAWIKAKQEDEKAASRWMQFSENVLRAMCRRFRSAATAKVNVDEVSVKPHPSAEVIAAYRRDLPDVFRTDADDRPACVLRIRYVRIEQRGRPSRILAYYRRQLPNGQERTTKDDFWIESLTLTEDGMSRSVDVLITKPKGTAPGMADQEQRVVVELATVECAENAAKVADKK